MSKNDTKRSASLVAPLAEGPMDIIGDVHGELDALRTLLQHLGYDPSGDHDGDRKLVFLGDLCDRGGDSPGVIDLVRGLIERGRAQCILGNHELNLLRRDSKHGNRWYLDPTHPECTGEFKHSKPAPSNHTNHDFFLSLPLALERSDLRVVHAAWHAPSVDRVRGDGLTSLELYERYDKEAHATIKASGIDEAASDELMRHERALSDGSRQVPLLPNLGKRDEMVQMHNPVRVLTSGPERVTAEPFFANGKWRMCDRVRWWDEYTGDIPVVVGHYWRMADEAGTGLNGGKPDVFAGSAAHQWLGPKQNVFCVDFSVGGRYRERALGANSFKTRLAALRWPERELVFDDGPRLTTRP